MSRSQSTATCIDTLTPADLKMFEDFGIPPELLEEAGVVRVSDAEARTVWGMLAPAHRPLQGMVFPYFSLDTGRRTGARLRRDNPEIENGKEKDKYISSYADRKTLFTSPGAAERLRDPETVIILVEAEKSALALEALARRYGLKLVAEGMGGCWGWRSGRIAKTENARGVRVDVAGPIPDLDILNGRKVIVALDSNVAHNKKVRDAQSALVRELKSRGCEVHVLKLPGDGGVNGPDDYIKTHGDHAMLKLVKDSYETAAYYDYGGGRFEVDDKGNTFTPPPDKEGHPKPPVWLCPRLDIVAKTRDTESGEWGRLLEWQDDDGVVHQWAMPMELLQRDGGVEARCELARQGLAISPSKAAKEYLATFLQAWPTEKRARCVDKQGWAKTSDGAIYVKGAEAIGSASESIVFQNAHSLSPAFAVSGTLEEWQENVARPAQGNTRLVFPISTSFAGPLLEIVNEQSGGFHLRGDSSTGKSTALEGAASTWGHPDRYRRNWRTTVNGLEGVATLHNDGILLIDEITQVEAKDAGQSVYLLANEGGKSRATRAGTGRPVASWRLLWLSAGETSLAGHMRAANLKPTAGQELRMVEIEGDAGVGMGVLEELHDKATAFAFIENFRRSARKFYGTAGDAFLRRLVHERAASDELSKWLKTKHREIRDDFMGSGSGPQIERVASRFAVVAVAGELATKWNLTGWPVGEAIKAAGRCFVSWMNNFGCDGKNREEQGLLEQVRLFFEQHGAARFEDLASEGNARIVNRAGFFRELNDKTREYMVLGEVFKQEVIAGFDPKFAKRVLIERGWLIPGDDKSAQLRTVPSMGRKRFWVISAKVFEGEE